MVHPNFYPNTTGVFFPGGKAAGVRSRPLSSTCNRAADSASSQVLSTALNSPRPGMKRSLCATSSCQITYNCVTHMSLTCRRHDSLLWQTTELCSQQQHGYVRLPNYSIHLHQHCTDTLANIPEGWCVFDVTLRIKWAGTRQLVPFPFPPVIAQST